MSDAVLKKKKSKETDRDDGKKSSKKKETETTKRSSSSKKERRGSPKKESFLQVSNTDALRKSAGGSSDFEAGVIFNRYTMITLVVVMRKQLTCLDHHAFIGMTRRREAF